MNYTTDTQTSTWYTFRYYKSGHNVILDGRMTLTAAYNRNTVFMPVNKDGYINIVGVPIIFYNETKGSWHIGYLSSDIDHNLRAVSDFTAGEYIVSGAWMVN